MYCIHIANVDLLLLVELSAMRSVQARGGRVPLMAGFWASGEVSRAAGARDCVPRNVFIRRYYPNYLRAPVRHAALRSHYPP